MNVSKLRLNRITVLAAEELLNSKGTVNIKIISGSMEPYVKTGEYLTFKSKTLCSRLKFGDIILCKQKYKGSLLVHRFYFRYRKNGRYNYITKADKGLLFDYPSTEEQYMGIQVGKHNKKRVMNILIVLRSVILFPIFVIMTKIKYKDWRL